MKRKDHTYALDHSAIIHLAARRKNHTNVFRIEMTLKEPVDHKILQKALDNIARCFPTVIAGIQKGFWNYRIVPAKATPTVKKETSCLRVMSETEIQNCAFRVLYQGKRIAVEFFHSLTDGHGGMVVTTSLVAEYLRLKYGIKIPDSKFVLQKECNIQIETKDDYMRFAGKKGMIPKYKPSFQLPKRSEINHNMKRTCYEYRVLEVLQLAHDYGVSVTTLLAALILQSVMEIQKTQPDRKKREQTVQIMIPIDLRRLFHSGTLRNFSFFALCGMEPQEEEIPFEQILQTVDTQLNSQNTATFMEKTIAGQVKTANFPVYKYLPLPIKMWVLRFVQEVCGENNSCISVSNLGTVSLPKAMEEQVERIVFTLSPRRKSSHNCSVVSYNEKLSVMFSKSCEGTELENIFSKNLKTIFQKHSIDKSLTKPTYNSNINKNK